jgi:hypothetical protein
MVLARVTLIFFFEKNTHCHKYRTLFFFFLQFYTFRIHHSSQSNNTMFDLFKKQYTDEELLTALRSEFHVESKF